MFQSSRVMSSNTIHGHSVRYLIGLGMLSLCAASSLAATLCVNPGGKLGCKSSISAAVSAASPGDTILVVPGTYKEQVVITKSISLVAVVKGEAIIDAKGLSNGIFINGMAASKFAMRTSKASSSQMPLMSP
jgi:pectin methylesterase-like acyl-CoA thioesterase